MEQITYNTIALMTTQILIAYGAWTDENPTPSQDLIQEAISEARFIEAEVLRRQTRDLNG